MTVIDYILQADATGILQALGKTEKALKDVDQQADKTSKVGGTAAKSLADKFEHTGAKMKGFGSAMTLGVTAPIVAGFGLMTAAAAEDAESQEILARNLKQMGGASEEAIEGAEDYISELSKMSGVADDELRPALSKLVSATGDTGKAQELLSLALDASVSKGKPMEAVSQALARGYQGSTGALGKLGIATKDAEGKALSFSQIQANLKTQVDGAAKAAGETGAGGFRRAKVAFDEAAESLGEKLLPFMSQIADAANGVLGFFDSLGPAGTTAALGLGAVAVGLGPVSTGLGVIMQNSTKILGWFKDLGTHAATAGTKAATAASGTADLIGKIGGVGSAAGGVSTVGQHLGTVSDNAKTAATNVGATSKHLANAGNMGSASGGLAAIKGHFSSIGSAAGGAGTSVSGLAAKFSNLGGVLKGAGIVAALATLAVGLEQFMARSGEFKANWADTFEHAKQGPQALRESLDRLQARNDELMNQGGLQRGWNKIWGDWKPLNEEIQRFNDRMRITDDVLAEVAGQTGLTTSELDLLASKLKIDLSQGTDEAKQSLYDAATGADDAKGAMGEFGDEVADTVDPIEDLKKAIDGIFDPIIDWEDAQTGFLELQSSISDLMADTELSGVQREIQARNQATAVMQSYEQMSDAARAQGATEDEVRVIAARHAEQLDILAAKFPEVRTLADTYIDALIAVPKGIDTSMSASAPVDFVARYSDAVRGIPTDRTTTLRMQFGDASTEPFLLRMLIANDLHKSGLSWAQVNMLGKTGHFARGGTFPGGTMAMVGEEGPELVAFGAAGRVHDAGTTQRILTGASNAAAMSVTVNVAGSVISERDLVQVVEDGLARQRRQSGSLAFLN